MSLPYPHPFPHVTMLMTGERKELPTASQPSTLTLEYHYLKGNGIMGGYVHSVKYIVGSISLLKRSRKFITCLLCIPFRFLSPFVAYLVTSCIAGCLVHMVSTVD